MKRLVVVLLVAALMAGGYLYYRQTSLLKLAPTRMSTPGLRLEKPPLDTDRLAKVLGEATSSLITSGTNLLNGVTDGQAEPVINKAVEDLQSSVKDLPKEQYEKVKYEFCKDIIVSPSPSAQGTI